MVPYSGERYSQRSYELLMRRRLTLAEMQRKREVEKIFESLDRQIEAERKAATPKTN